MIKLSKSCLGNDEKKAVADVLDREYLGMGDEVRLFEKELTDFFGRPAVCVSTGTSALHLALQAIGIGPGCEVLVQSLTYVASFQAISATGATPVACEIDPNTLCIDLHDAEKKITSKTKAIMPVHYSGGVGELGDLYDFASKYELRVIEDAAHAFGSEYKSEKVGGFGDIACFSFDGIKNITSGEGGCVVTNDTNVLKKVRDSRLLGVENDSQKRFSNQRSWNFDVVNQGWRYHMSNIMAAIGISQLKKFSVASRKRRDLAIYYERALLGCSKIKTLNLDYGEVVPQIFVVILNASINRDKLRSTMLENGVETGIHYFPNHLLTYYLGSASLRKTEAVYKRILTLPLHPDLSFNDVAFVVKNLLSILNIDSSKMDLH